MNNEILFNIRIYISTCDEIEFAANSKAMQATEGKASARKTSRALSNITAFRARFPYYMSIYGDYGSHLSPLQICRLVT